MDLYFKAFPRVKYYIEESHRMALWNRKVWTPFGQYKHSYAAQEAFRKTAAYNASLRNAQNVRIQSATSTLGLITFAALNAGVKPLGANSICTVYDSTELEVPISRGAEVINEAFYYMDDWPLEQFDFLTLPIGSEAEVGFNWGQVDTIKRGITQVELERVLKNLDTDRFEKAYC